MSYKIQLHNPCKENWNAMTPSQQGKFCAVCKKDVIDFTNFSSSQLNKKLKTSGCGRFRQSQLDVHYESQSRNPFAKVAAAVGITALLTGASAATAQTTVPTVEQRSTGKALHPKQQIQKTVKSQDSLTIKGKVVDESGEGLLGATVLIKNTVVGTTTDFDGNYAIQIPATGDKTAIILVFSYIGYESYEVAIDNVQENTVITMNQSLEVIVTGGYSVRRSFFGRLFNVFRSKENRY